MSKAGAQARALNPNWKGGRSIASNGYVLIKVGTGHHLADVRGYAYEHRLVAERKLGRRLLRMPGEPNPTIACACGCGESFAKFDAHGRPRRFVTGHNTQKAA